MKLQLNLQLNLQLKLLRRLKVLLLLQQKGKEGRRSASFRCSFKAASAAAPPAAPPAAALHEGERSRLLCFGSSGTSSACRMAAVSGMCAKRCAFSRNLETWEATTMTMRTATRRARKKKTKRGEVVGRDDTGVILVAFGLQVAHPRRNPNPTRMASRNRSPETKGGRGLSDNNSASRVDNFIAR
mmetsp:Transcript_57529/g.115514  ORF Transcript_57529/g.115514 Transcript_57529/m.115514 type:complete len:185 (+) Transcript_57529:1306-1860(+)